MENVEMSKSTVMASPFFSSRAFLELFHVCTLHLQVKSNPSRDGKYQTGRLEQHKGPPYLDGLLFNDAVQVERQPLRSTHDATGRKNFTTHSVLYIGPEEEEAAAAAGGYRFWCSRLNSVLVLSLE